MGVCQKSALNWLKSVVTLFVLLCKIGVLDLRKGMKRLMNIAIFDKSKDYQNKIKNLIIENYDVKEDPLKVKCYYDIDQFMQDNQDDFFQIAFIDCQQLGMDAARELRKVNLSCLIIMMSHTDDYIEEAFQLRASEYLLKPFDNKTFYEILHFVLDWYFKHDIKFIVPIRELRRKRFFTVDEIKYVETYYNDIDIITVDDNHYVTHVKNRYRIRKALLPRWFLQVNQSILVNMKHIDFMTDRNVILKTREVFPLSRSKLIKNHLKYERFLKNRNKE